MDKDKKVDEQEVSTPKFNNETSSEKYSQVVFMDSDEEEVLMVLNVTPAVQKDETKRSRKPTQKSADFLCRICGQQSYKLLKIFGSQGKQLELATKIQFHLPIEVSEKDVLPLGICLACVKELKACDELYEKCLSTNRQLSEIFKKRHLGKSNLSEGSAVLPLKRKKSLIPEEIIETQSLDTKCLSIDLEEENSEMVAPQETSNHCEDFQIGLKSQTDASKSASASACTRPVSPKHRRVENKKCSLPETTKEGKSNCATSIESNSNLLEDVEIAGERHEKDDSQEENLDFPNEGEKCAPSTETCDICQETFQGILRLRKHRKTHSAEERLKCQDCGKVLPNDSSFYGHKRTHSAISPCDICGKILSNRDCLNRHKKIVHSDPEFCCQICGKTTRTKAKLVSHLAMHSDERPYTCSICGEGFKLKSTLKQHFITHSDMRKFMCDMCGYTCHRTDHLRRHKCTHHGERMRSGRGSNEAQRKKSFRRLTCRMCSLTFTGRKALSKHYLSDHNDSENLLCCLCEKKFDSVLSLVKHEKWCLSRRKCEYCGIIVARGYKYEYHVRKHTGELPFLCKYCGKGFRGKHVLVGHERTHTGERPFKCTACSKAFYHYTNLLQHKITHGAERKFNCNLCPYKALRPGNLRNHMKVHSEKRDYECSTCGRAYKHSYDYKKHIALHSSGLPLPVKRKSVNHPKVSIETSDGERSNDLPSEINEDVPDNF